MSEGLTDDPVMRRLTVTSTLVEFTLGLDVLSENVTAGVAFLTVTVFTAETPGLVAASPP